MSKIDPINPTIPPKKAKKEDKTFRDSLKREQFTKKPNEEFIDVLKRKMKQAEDNEIDERD